MDTTVTTDGLTMLPNIQGGDGGVSTMNSTGFDLGTFLNTSGLNDSFLNNSSNDINHLDADDGYNTNPRLVNGVIVLLLLILNLLGNSVVFYVYRFKLKKTVFAYFVTILAALDLLTALTTMLMDVIMKMRPIDETVLNLTVLCKLTHFQVYANSLISGCVLTLIAYQRYRKICHPLRASLSMANARFILIIMTMICVLLSVCTLIINGPTDIQVKSHKRVVTTTICRYDESFNGTAIQPIFSYMLLSAFCLVLVLIIAFYVRVHRALRKFERRTSLRASSPPISPDIEMINKEQGFSNASGNSSNKRESKDAQNFPPLDTRRTQYQDKFQQGRMSVMSLGGGNERVSSQMYRVFAIVTGVFIISYLPHLAVLILNKSYMLDHKVLTYAQCFTLELAYNCPYISTVVNPVIYGFRSSEFRDQVKSMLSFNRFRH